MRCKTCGQIEAAHDHPFDPIETPGGCKCPAHFWAEWTDGDIPKPCDSFLESGDCCINCSHVEVCHSGKSEAGA